MATEQELLAKISRLEKQLDIAMSALSNIENWNDDLEEMFDDPGACAQEARQDIIELQL